MFDNANVVFTTKNVDGISSVNRTECNKNKIVDRSDEVENSKKKKKSSKSKKKRGKRNHDASAKERQPLSVSN